MNRQNQASSSLYEEQHEDGEEEEANLSPNQLLQLAETHLRLRNYSLCRQYALESQQTNHPNSLSNHKHASQLLAISNILSSPTNFYSILQIDTFSNDITLIHTQFKHLLSILDPIKDKSSLVKEAVNLVWEAYDCLSDPTKKTQFDSQFSGEKGSFNEVEKMGSFWTFCPYCFYMYEYSRVYEGCCLRCQNQICRRSFHGVALNSLPKMELEKGVYFGCFGYFPLGFSPGGLEKGNNKFDSWSPIVGMFPVRRIGKTRAGRVDLNGEDEDDDNNGVGNEFIEIPDESDESENDQGVNGGESNVEGGNVGKTKMMKRKSVAWSARKLMSRGRRSNEGVAANGYGGYGKEGEGGEYGFGGDYSGVRGGSGFQSEDMAFFEENGEIFVGFGPDDAL